MLVIGGFLGPLIYGCALRAVEHPVLLNCATPLHSSVLRPRGAKPARTRVELTNSKSILAREWPKFVIHESTTTLCPPNRKLFR
jgi:hypothetical protein